MIESKGRKNDENRDRGIPPINQRYLASIPALSNCIDESWVGDSTCVAFVFGIHRDRVVSMGP